MTKRDCINKFGLSTRLTLIAASLLMLTLNVGCPMNGMDGDMTPDMMDMTNDNMSPDTTDNGDLAQAVFNADSVMLVGAIAAVEDALLAYVNPSSLSGNVAFDASLVPDKERVNGIQVNSAGHVILLTDNDRIDVYESGDSLAAGSPDRSVVPPDGVRFTDIVLDRGRDILYVVARPGTPAMPMISVYTDTIMDSFDGGVAPARTFSTDALGANTAVNGLEATSGDELYILTFLAGVEEIHVFEGASELEGNRIADRTFSFPRFSEGFGHLGEFEITANGAFYMFATREIDGGLHEGIITAPDATALNGAINEPDYVHRLPDESPFQDLPGVAVDRNGDVYFGAEEGIVIYENALGRDETAAVDRTIGSSFTASEGERALVEPDYLVIVD